MKSVWKICRVTTAMWKNRTGIVGKGLMHGEYSRIFHNQFGNSDKDYEEG